MMLFDFSIHCTFCHMETLDLAFLKCRFYPLYFACLHTQEGRCHLLYKITKLLFTPIFLCNLIDVGSCMLSTPEDIRLRQARFPKPWRVEILVRLPFKPFGSSKYLTIPKRINSLIHPYSSPKISPWNHPTVSVLMCMSTLPRDKTSLLSEAYPLPINSLS